jgi:hypothetical protein
MTVTGRVTSELLWRATLIYSAVFPAWFRWWLPLGYGLLFGALALGFWRLSVAAPRWPAVWFSLLGGLVSLVGHGIGIRRGLLKVPRLAEASAASALVFGVFEFVFYSCVIVGLAVAARKLSRTRHREYSQSLRDSDCANAPPACCSRAGNVREIPGPPHGRRGCLVPAGELPAGGAGLAVPSLHDRELGNMLRTHVVRSELEPGLAAESVRER